VTRAIRYTKDDPGLFGRLASVTRINAMSCHPRHSGLAAHGGFENLLLHRLNIAHSPIFFSSGKAALLMPQSPQSNR
jgi:hypothetical protein